jgi:hypothetical protein
MTLYRTELARKQANDQLCKDFAAQVQPLVDHILSSMDKLAKPEVCIVFRTAQRKQGLPHFLLSLILNQGSLEDQLKLVNSAIQTAAAHEANIDSVAKMEEDMKVRIF